ncbi:tubulin/FtsZ family protein [Halorarum salinum]|uniref:Tubulin-like protein CetZ n=1 Tax=Halorarum salinum TaxID=2743089 RepID=A0A7D5QCG6_9EURY|nr:tubulin/FtsZ family protein [Halobaculum salinum]QLG63737.1 cell division protein [Halobaculum salinum]
MKIALIGFGNAGGKVADEVFAYQTEVGRSLCRSILAVNSARVDLARIERVPDDDRILIGQTDDRVKGHGVGSDPELGGEITRKDLHEIERAIDDVPIYDVDAFLVVAGLGGGTGSGGAPVLCSALRETYREPVYGLGILPSEEEGGRASFNAARSFRSFVDATDNLVVFDNDAWRAHDDSVGAGYERTNREIAKRVETLLSAGSVDGPRVSENAMDASDVRRTLATGGIATVAYAETDVERSTRDSRGLLSRFRNGESEGETDTAKKISGLVRQAVQSRLTCPADVASAERSLIVVTGPPEELSRKGLESARRWVEQRTDSVEVLAGDGPRPSAETVSAVVLLSNVTDVPRIERLQSQAVDAQENVEAQAATRQEEIQQLITDEGGSLDPL